MSQNWKQKSRSQYPPKDMKIQESEDVPIEVKNVKKVSNINEKEVGEMPLPRQKMSQVK